MTAWEDIVGAVQLSLGGQRERGRRQLEACWSGTVPDDHAQRCVLAHYLADTQDDLDDEIGWDETALHEFAHVGEHELSTIGIASAAGLAPSLHLNLGARRRHRARPRRPRTSRRAPEPRRRVRPPRRRGPGPRAAGPGPLHARGAAGRRVRADDPSRRRRPGRAARRWLSAGTPCRGAATRRRIRSRRSRRTAAPDRGRARAPGSARRTTRGTAAGSAFRCTGRPRSRRPRCVRGP